VNAPVIILTIAVTASIGHADVPEARPVLFRTGSACAAVAPHERCERLQRLAVRGTDGVELYRRAPTPAGYALELVVHTGARTTVATLVVSGGGCAAGTCVDDSPRSAVLHKLDTAAFGVVITSTVTVSHTFKEAKPVPPTIASGAVGCVVTADGAECLQLGVGERFPVCRATGWRGTRAIVLCSDGAHDIELAAPGQPATYDAARVSALMQELVNETFANRTDCAKLTQSVTELLDGNPAIVALARAKDTQRSKPVQDPLWTILRILNFENQACLSDAGFRAALMRLAPP
jgi:hypothetical protein